MTSSAPRHVLIVEDNRDSREILRMLLEILGHRVEVAADGQEGVELALSSRPDTAVVDLGLPVLNGFQVAQRMRAALGSRIRLIAMTAYTLPEYRQRALEAGFDHYLAKPADPDELARLLTE